VLAFNQLRLEKKEFILLVYIFFLLSLSCELRIDTQMNGECGSDEKKYISEQIKRKLNSIMRKKYSSSSILSRRRRRMCSKYFF
jgi:hypothetical protein